MLAAVSLEGIISYLTKKHGGSVHDKGIVEITSKSVDGGRTYGPMHVADLSSDSFFRSQNGPDEWICWDFGKMLVQPTHYTIRAWGPRSWVVEGSMDGESWTEIDRQTGNSELTTLVTASFAVSNSAQCRLIRLTTTGQNHFRQECLALRAVEFFGTLAE
jgi:hypothetical protein